MQLPTALGGPHPGLSILGAALLSEALGIASGAQIWHQAFLSQHSCAHNLPLLPWEPLRHLCGTFII